MEVIHAQASDGLEQLGLEFVMTPLSVFLAEVGEISEGLPR